MDYRDREASPSSVVDFVVNTVGVDNSDDLSDTEFNE